MSFSLRPLNCTRSIACTWLSSCRLVGVVTSKIRWIRNILNSRLRGLASAALMLLFARPYGRYDTPDQFVIANAGLLSGHDKAGVLRETGIGVDFQHVGNTRCRQPNIDAGVAAQFEQAPALP